MSDRVKTIHCAHTVLPVIRDDTTMSAQIWCQVWLLVRYIHYLVEKKSVWTKILKTTDETRDALYLHFSDKEFGSVESNSYFKK